MPSRGRSLWYKREISAVGILGNVFGNPFASVLHSLKRVNNSCHLENIQFDRALTDTDTPRRLCLWFCCAACLTQRVTMLAVESVYLVSSVALWADVSWMLRSVAQEGDAWESGAEGG